MKTLIVTTTTTIRDMWATEISNFFPFKAGIVGGGKFDINSPIVVANIQTLRNKANELKNEFGLVIVDEVHRSPAKTFTDTLDSLKAKYKVGLSGTMVRKDGKECVLQDYFGFKKFVGKVENTLEPTIHLYESDIELNGNEFIPWANKITELMNNQGYLNSIEFLSNSYADKGYRVLVVCDRTEPLEHWHMRSNDRSVMITGKVKGAQNRQDVMGLISSGEADILYATQSIFSEGVSLNELSAIILATPVNNEPLLEQLVGRIMRNAKDKLMPVVIDVGLAGGTGKRHRNNRKAFYISKGWDIKYIGTIT